MCTSLLYSDASGRPYLGRTLELDVEEPWVIVYVPVGVSFSSTVDNDTPVTYDAKHAFLGITAPARMPSKENPLTANDLKVAEGLNTEGLSFSVLAYPSTDGVQQAVDATLGALQASDLGSWVLSQFSTVEDVKAALKEQPIFLTKVEVVGNATFPFHIVVHDKTGASLVIEWFQGEENVYDNPVGVMTNGPRFPWHLTNLENWTHLTNVDQSKATFGSLEVRQPDSGIATAALPASNTSVGRFVRAVFYSNFVEKVDDPDEAMLTLARIMDNFDRPRGATTSPPAAAGEGISFQGIDKGHSGPPTEFTNWTNLSDLSRGLFYLRTYESFGYTRFDLNELASAKEPRAMLSTQLDTLGGDASATLLASTI